MRRELQRRTKSEPLGSAGDQRVLAPRLEVDSDVPGGVAGRELEADLVGDAVIGCDEVGEPGIDDRSDRVLERQRALRRDPYPATE